MSRFLLQRPPRVRALLLAGALGLLATACGSLGEARPSPTPEDDFAVVRGVAEASYQRGRQHLQQGELEAALVELDRAKLYDPDGRPEIQQALDETLQHIRALPPTPAPTPAPTRTPLPAAVAYPPVETPQAVASATDTPTGPTRSLPAGFALWNDRDGRFSLAAPADWKVASDPQTPFGTGVVAFREPAGRADLAVAIDETAPTVSPELYAARMELAMQQAPGYALESVVPGTTATFPSLRRSFTVSPPGAGGRGQPMRGFQLAVLRGKTPYILAASAPATEYPQFASVFEQIVATFAFD